MKEMFARMKAVEPRSFEDRHFDDIFRDLPSRWRTMSRQVAWAEGFGVHTEDEPAEWRGLEEWLTPAVYVTPRPDTVTICVGALGAEAEHRFHDVLSTMEPGAEYDFL